MGSTGYAPAVFVTSVHDHRPSNTATITFDTAAAIISCVTVRAYRDSILHDSSTILLKDIDQIWRIIIGLGCVPAAIALYFRLTIPETPRFTMDVKQNVQRAARDVDEFMTSEAYTVDPDAVAHRAHARKATKEDFRTYFSKWENLKVLIGTAYSWFALDVSEILSHIAIPTILDMRYSGCILRPRSEFFHHPRRHRLWLS